MSPGAANTARGVAQEVEAPMRSADYPHTTLHPRHRRELGYVYFIGAASESPVKIGWAVNPQGRLSDLQVAHWETLTVLGRIRAAGRVEAEIHRVLAAHRIRGEWFDRGPALAFYERLRAAESPYLRASGSELVAENPTKGLAR